jgi:tetratricopeptide (TPR) repeat protein
MRRRSPPIPRPWPKNLRMAGFGMVRGWLPIDSSDSIRRSPASKLRSTTTPQHRDAHLALAFTLTRLQRYPEALTCLSQPLRERWADPRLYACHAHILRRQGDAAAALSQIRHAVRLDPENPRSWFQQGMTLAHLCRYEEAHHALTEALKRQIYFVQGWLVLGLTLRQLHQYEEAIEAFNKALSIEPDQALAFFQQACCYAALDRQDWAIEHLRRAIKLNPQKYLPRCQQDELLKTISPAVLG